MTTMRTDGRGPAQRSKAALGALLAALLTTIALAVAPSALAQQGPGGGGGGGMRGGGGGDMRGGGGGDMRGGAGGGEMRGGGGGYRGGDPRGGGSYYAPGGARGAPQWHGPPPRGGYPAGGYYGGYYGRGYYYPPPAHYYAYPPRGYVVTVLPPYYTTLWFAGVPYFYVDGAYYLWRERDRHYEVVEPPAEAANSAPASTPDDLFVYPKSGQSEELQGRDRYDCHRWAAGQTGYDPTLPSAADAERAKREEYRRAMTACLEGRGYSVK